MFTWTDTGHASNHLQPTNFASLEHEFQTVRTKKSLKFSCFYLATLVVSTTIYNWKYLGNSIPTVCACINASFAICAMGCHFCRCLSRAPVIFHSLGLLVVSMLGAISHPEVQHFLYESFSVMHAFGQPPSCDRPEGPRCTMRKDSYESLMLVELVMTYHILFLLSFRAAILSGVPSIILYIMVTYVLGIDFIRGETLKYAIFLVSFIFVFMAKYTMESSQRILFFDVQAQRMNAVQEKVLRCEAEFRSERMQESLATSARQDHGNQSTKSGGAPSSAGCFITIDDDADPRDTLQRIRAIGHQEHWLLDISSITVYRDQVLGRGGFGVVLKGCFCRTSVALKLAAPQRHGKSDCQTLLSLANELRILRRLRHPNIVLFHGACIEFSKSQLVLVIELVNGTNLENWIRVDNTDLEFGCDRPLKTECAKHVVLLDVSSALSYLHGQSPCIVHGDIKASNIMIESPANQPRAKLLDFGLSRLLTPNAQPLGGTLRWMAPEVAKGRCHPTSASDVFSFGRLMYFIITEQLPFADYDKHKLLRVLVQKKYSPSLVWPECMHGFPEECRLIGEGCMQVEQGARPRIIAVHDDIHRSSSLSSRARDVQVGDDGDAIDLIEFIQCGKEKPVTQQSEILVSQSKVQPTDATACLDALPIENSHRHDVLPSIPRNDVCDHVADVAETGVAFPHNDLELGRLKPTPIRTKMLDLLEVMALWHDTPNSCACCPFHNSLRGLEQVVNVLQRRCGHDWGAKHDYHQCPKCLRLIAPEAGGCAWCRHLSGLRDTTRDGIRGVQSPAPLKCQL